MSRLALLFSGNLIMSQTECLCNRKLLHAAGNRFASTAIISNNSQVHVTLNSIVWEGGERIEGKGWGFKIF